MTAEFERKREVGQESEIPDEDFDWSDWLDTLTAYNTPQSKLPKLFLLPDGSWLRFSRPRDLGNESQWKRISDTPTYRNWFNKIKTQNLRLGLWTSKTNQYVVAADFDTLVGLHCSSYDQLERKCLSEYGATAIVGRSFSDKVKVFFVVELDGVKMDVPLALEFLESVLTETHYQIIDKIHTSLKITYLVPQLTRQLSERLPELFVYRFKPVVSSRRSVKVTKGNTATNNETPIQGQGSSSIVQQSPKFSVYPGLIQCPKLVKFIGKLESRNQFVRILLTSKGLFNSFDIPTTLFAKMLGVTPAAISKWIRDLKRLDLLEVVSNSYKIGSKAKSYRAINDLRSELNRINPSANTTASLPIRISDGKWNDELYRARRHFEFASEFEAWVKTLPGHALKDRPKKMKDIIKNHFPRGKRK